MRSIVGFIIAILLSTIVIVCAYYIWTGGLRISAFPVEIDPITNKPTFSISDFANYLSGVFNTLALIWLVVNAWQQREDLMLQRQEMEKNNEQQEQQAIHLKDSAKVELENLLVQKELYTEQKILPRIQTIHNFLIIYNTQMNVKVTGGPINELQSLLQRNFSESYTNGDEINLFKANGALLATGNQFRGQDIEYEFRFVNAMIRFNQNCKSLSRIVSTELCSFKFEGDSLKNYLLIKSLFDELDHHVNQLSPNYQHSIKSIYKLNDVGEGFNILNKLSFFNHR